MDAYTIAWIEHAEAIVRDEHPEFAHDFYCTQGSYQGDGGDPDSGNTHALGGPVDLRWCGHTFCLLALRRAGGFVWWRKPLWRNGVLVWPDHIHGGPIGHPFMDPSAQRQEVAYLNGRNGLADNGPDDGPRINPIPRPVWPWPPEDDMADYAEQLNRIEKALLTFRDREAARDKAERQRARAYHDAVMALLDKLADDVSDNASRAQVKRVRVAIDALAAPEPEPEP